ncbi:MAG: hypothetical protein FJ319_02660 [SAR202 cluster bacterium]|nr:hypothetical protein [SAR202 cluster bacterium]
MRTRLGVAATLAVALVAAVAVPAVVLANGRVVDFERKAAGPYEVALGTIPADPSVGNLHLTMTVTDSATRSIVTDADITITGAGPDATAVEIGPLRAEHDIRDPSYYDVATAVDREGEWRFTVAVAGPAGQGSAEYSVKVKNASPLAGLVTLGMLVGFVAIFALAIRASLSSKSRKSNPKPKS